MTTSDRALFDFTGFLAGGALDDVFRTHTPKSGPGKWEVTRLSGGLINVTVRVVRREDRKSCEKNSRRSVVIKYAPPFVAGIGEGMPLGTFRQVIEYRALTLLSSTPSIKTAEAAYGVSIPRVLKFFEDKRVLVLRDLGEDMVSLGTWMYPQTTSTARSSPSPEMCSSVGARLGGFLASLHCDPTLLSKSQLLTDNGRRWFENPETKDFVRDEVVGKVLPIIRLYLGPPAEKIANTISQDFQRNFLDFCHPPLSSSPSSQVTQSMFSVGDLWTESFLIVTPFLDPNYLDEKTEPGIGFIDWEFAGPARIGQDMTQLCAWIYLFSTSSAWSLTRSHSSRTSVGVTALSSTSAPGPRNSAAVVYLSEDRTNLGSGEMLGSAGRNLLDAMLKAYATKVSDYPDYAWFVGEERDQRRFKKERLAVIRSVWISFGREIIYVGVEAKRIFARFFSADATGGEDEVKMWQREVIAVGCWYISMAGQKEDEEFGGVVREERLLKKMYTISASL